jgi:Skp family chaperone for outer membrane proteins
MRRVLCAALVLGLLPPSFAAAQGVQPAANALGGAPIPGLCLLSQQEVLTRAKVGQAATARLQVLAQQAQNEVTAERGPIETEAKALQAQRATLKPADFQDRQKALQGRLQALQQKANVRSREIELTREKALGRIANDAQPVIAAVYKTHGCGLLMDRGSVLGGNMSNDLTGGVIEALDAKITTITFEREALPPPAPAR